MKPEAAVLNAIIRELTRRKKAGEPIWFLKVHGSAMQRAGIPDLIVCYYGRFVAIEVKAPGEEATKLQAHTLAKIDFACGFPLVADNVVIVSTWLDSIRKAIAASSAAPSPA